MTPVSFIQTNRNRHNIVTAERFYVIALRTGIEAKYIAGTRHLLESEKGRLVWPRRHLSIRRAGRTIDSIASLYPGYLFWRTRELSDDCIMTLRKGPGFMKFLKNNREIVPLDDRDASLLGDLLEYGEIMRKSTVRFDENRRIRVVDGPLRHLEGNIVKVDRRKGRAKVALSLQGRTILVDVGFEVLEDGEQ
jgi:transcriptional antiterminator NusG